MKRPEIKHRMQRDEKFKNVEHLKHMMKCPVCLRYYRKAVHTCSAAEPRPVAREAAQ